MTIPTNADDVTVGQEDRKLIAAIIMEYDGTDTGRRMARNVLDKNHDDDKILALAVSHRIAHQSTGELPDDVRELVIAARIFWDVHNDTSPESHDLDKALEAFASRVPYENEPDEIALAIKGGEVDGK